jgi:xanthosine utilization system XapX-like protein
LKFGGVIINNTYRDIKKEIQKINYSLLQKARGRAEQLITDRINKAILFSILFMLLIGIVIAILVELKESHPLAFIMFSVVGILISFGLAQIWKTISAISRELENAQNIIFGYIQTLRNSS